MKLRTVLMASAIFVMPAFAQTEGNYLIRYITNSTTAGAVVNISNTGSSIGQTYFANGANFTASGNICANVYVFSPDEELQECCSCLVTPNALKYLTAADLTTNNATPTTYTSFVIKITASIAQAGSSPTLCTPYNTPSGAVPTGVGFGGITTTASSVGLQPASPGNSTTNQVLGTGLVAWGTTIHFNSFTEAETETAFTNGQLSTGELTQRLDGLCQNIVNDGSGFGICNLCHTGGE